MNISSCNETDKCIIDQNELINNTSPSIKKQATKTNLENIDIPTDTIKDNYSSNLDVMIAENNAIKDSHSRYYIEINANTELEMETQYAFVHTKELENKSQNFSTKHFSSNNSEKENQLWITNSVACNQIKFEQNIEEEENLNSCFNSVCNNTNQSKLTHTKSNNSLESSTSLTTFSPVNSIINQDSEKKCSNSPATTIMHEEQQSNTNAKNTTLTTLTPLRQIQLGQIYSGHPPIQCSTPITSDTLSHILQTEHLPQCSVSQGSSPNLHSPTDHSRNVSMSLLTNTTTWTPYNQTSSKYYGLTSTPVSITSTLSLNSSGEEIDNVSLEYPRAPHNTPVNCEMTRLTIPVNNQVSQIAGSLDNMQYYLPFNGRENHNEKERKRRNRIKNACQTLRNLVPGLSEKTDKATVFEYTVQYLMHLKRQVGPKYDKDFVEKCSPY